MPSLQIRDLPQDVYDKLKLVAESEHRSLAQQALVLLKQALVMPRQEKTNTTSSYAGESSEEYESSIPSPTDLIREDRDSRS